MNEIEIKFNEDSPQEKGSTITISVDKKSDKELLYKFMIGLEGIWQVIKDFSEEESAEWTPENDGKYLIMVQAKEKSSTRPFDFVSRVDYIIGRVEKKIITSLNVDKNVLKIGEKLNLSVESSRSPVVYKYWIKEKNGWEVIRDYSPDNILSFSVKNPGKHEILVECKVLDSRNDYDDFQKIQFEVQAIKDLEITDFRCLSTELLVGEELLFQVEASHEDNRMILYKFVKIDSSGITTCIQDYSTKRMVSYVETESGSYRLLCMAKDMYSPKEYDDRAVITYSIKVYNPVVIQSFTSDVSSPQVTETPITLKAIVKGGKSLQYRFIIDGNASEDSGYTRDSEYVWHTPRAGKYKLDLWVKDSSYEGKYEAQAAMDFEVDELSKLPVKITQVLMDKEKDYIKNETVNIKVIATGGTDLRYSFIVMKDGAVKEKVEYGSCSWVNFTPEEAGSFELDVRVKDKYSTKEYDSHSVLFFDVLDFMPAAIDYVLLPARELYLVGDEISFEVITRNTRDTKIKYILRINGHKVEETDYVSNKKYSINPKCSGSYVVELLAKNSVSPNAFDSKKEVKIYVQDALPVTNARLQCDKTEISVNEPVIFTAKSDGGKDVCYEFYLMEQNEWNTVQKYSKKNYYSFIPFASGIFRILVLCKSEYKNCAYEDYATMEIHVK